MSVFKSMRQPAGTLALLCAISMSLSGLSVSAKPEGAGAALKTQSSSESPSHTGANPAAGAVSSLEKDISVRSRNAPAEAKPAEPEAKPISELGGERKLSLNEQAEQALQLANAQALDHFDMSRFYMSQWDLEMAEIELEAAIMYMPKMKVAHRDYSVVSLLRGHPLRALAEVMMVVGLGEPIPLNDQERIEVCKRAAKLHYRKALSYGKKDRWENAISELKWALDYQPDNMNIQRSLAFAYASKGDFDQAERQYNASLSADDSDPTVHADFAYLLADKGQGERAFSQMAQAVKRAPGAAAFHVDLAWMAETKGDFAVAQDELREAIKLSPKHAGLWTHLGRVLERRGDPSEARYAYQHALWIDPEQLEAKRRLEQIPATAKPAAGDRTSGPEKAAPEAPKVAPIGAPRAS